MALRTQLAKDKSPSSAALGGQTPPTTAQPMMAFDKSIILKERRKQSGDSISSFHSILCSLDKTYC